MSFHWHLECKKTELFFENPTKLIKILLLYTHTVVTIVTDAYWTIYIVMDQQYQEKYVYYFFACV